MLAGFFFCGFAIVSSPREERITHDLQAIRRSGIGRFFRRSGAGRSRRAIRIRADFAGEERAEGAGIPQPQSQRQDSGAAPAGRRDRHRVAGHPAHLGRSFPQSGLLAGAGMRPPAPPPIAGSPSWRARSIPLSRSWIIPRVSRRKARRRMPCAKWRATGPRTASADRTGAGGTVSAAGRIFAARYLCRDVLALERGRGTGGRQNLPRLTALAKAVSDRPTIAPVWERHFERR